MDPGLRDRAADLPLNPSQRDLERQSDRDVKVGRGGLTPLAPTIPTSLACRIAAYPRSQAFSFGCGWTATSSGPRTSKRAKISWRASSRSRSGTAGLRHSVENSPSKARALRSRTSSGRATTGATGRLSRRHSRANASTEIDPASWHCRSQGCAAPWPPAGGQARSARAGGP